MATRTKERRQSLNKIRRDRGHYRKSQIARTRTKNRRYNANEPGQTRLNYIKVSKYEA